MQLKRISTGEVIFSRLEIADTFVKRLTGLLRHTGLAPEAAMFFPDCRSIHTFFMRFSIDVAFLSRDYTIVEIHPDVGPERIVSCRDRAGCHVLEANAMSMAGTLEINETLQITD
ncbi:MAG: DUF192 domain-containing protein [Spartobacteria bacterium]|nr:DUF192 domain-containing protein [Spartobacteria bacterium]